MYVYFIYILTYRFVLEKLDCISNEITATVLLTHWEVKSLIVS